VEGINMKKPTPFIVRYIVCLLLTNGLILGAWLGGASPSWWTFALAAVFSSGWASLLRGAK
jgi:hypothetical protein